MSDQERNWTGGDPRGSSSEKHLQGWGRSSMQIPQRSDNCCHCRWVWRHPGWMVGDREAVLSSTSDYAAWSRAARWRIRRIHAVSRAFQSFNSPQSGIRH